MGSHRSGTWFCGTSGSQYVTSGQSCYMDPVKGHQHCTGPLFVTKTRTYASDDMLDEASARQQALDRCQQSDPKPEQCDPNPACQFTN